MNGRRGRLVFSAAAVLAVSAVLWRPVLAQPPTTPAAIQLSPACGPAAPGTPPVYTIAVTGVNFNPFTAVLVTFDADTGGTPESFDKDTHGVAITTDGFGGFQATIGPALRPAGFYLVRADDFREREATATFTVTCASPPPAPAPPVVFNPTMRFVPAITRTAWVVSLRGTGFPPSATVHLAWGGIFGRAVPARGLPASVTTGADGSLTVPTILVFVETELGTQKATATPGGAETFAAPPIARLLVVAGTVQPPGFKERR
jgi:hypothetical protein